MRTLLRTVFFISLSVLCVHEHYCSDFLDEGSRCQQLGLVGICKQIKDCDIALDSLRRKGKHDLKRCGFVNLEEVVCCPDLSDRNPTLETTTLDSNAIWRDTDKNVNKKPPSGDSDEDVDYAQRLHGKRKCEKACEKLLTANNVKPEIDFHIINGEDAAPGEFPHMAALGIETEFGDLDWKECAGSLIASKFLLTAAHCFVRASRPVVKKARFGVINLDDSGAQDIDIKNITVHSKYNPSSKHNDIAVVELVRDVTTSKYVYPACLYTETDDPKGMLITGWGQKVFQKGDQRAEKLQKARLIAVSVAECNNTLLQRSSPGTSKTILNTQICATSDKQSDACQGDSGGPLQIEKKEGGYAIVGIISYGVACGSKLPGVYTRVSRYLNWIESIVWPD